MRTPVAFNPQPLSARHVIRNKAIFFTTFLGYAVFGTLGYLSYHADDWIVCLANAVGLVICGYTGYAARRPQPPEWFVAPFAVYLVAFIWYLILSGYRGGVGAAWVLLVPVFAMLALGTRAGAVVTVLQLPVIIYGFYFSDSVTEAFVSMEVRTRLLVVYLVTSVFCLVYSLAADQYDKSLSKARERIVGLEQMLPVCAYCKKVRYDNRWDSVESYLAGSSDLQVSQGICPDCLQAHVADEKGAVFDLKS